MNTPPMKTPRRTFITSLLATPLAFLLPRKARAKAAPEPRDRWTIQNGFLDNDPRHRFSVREITSTHACIFIDRTPLDVSPSGWSMLQAAPDNTVTRNRTHYLPSALKTDLVFGDKHNLIKQALRTARVILDKPRPAINIADMHIHDHPESPNEDQGPIHLGVLYVDEGPRHRILVSHLDVIQRLTQHCETPKV